ncbi:unnamed protein product [Parascedosporium putredinis]|uniref:Uncharacterized protein n=1 Tax=Parascedosporium putredinis TaxID=1442378 RepID=A0A9P1H9B5_9PEZI|nr:unnamed protein product [Parascedosporium putredinis]CAI8001751.1 unnamed protein product [Parascedosporium putredinis]
MGAVVSCIQSVFRGIGRALSTIVSSIGGILHAIINGVVSICNAIISFLTCGYCGRRRSRVGGAGTTRTSGRRYGRRHHTRPARI